MFFSGIDHWFFLFQNVLVSGTVHIAAVGGSSSCDEDGASWEGACWGIVLYFAVVDGGETVAVGDGAEGEYFFPFSEEADFGVDFMADLYEGLISCEGHD